MALPGAGKQILRTIHNAQVFSVRQQHTTTHDAQVFPVQQFTEALCSVPLDDALPS